MDQPLLKDDKSAENTAPDAKSRAQAEGEQAPGEVGAAIATGTTGAESATPAEATATREDAGKDEVTTEPKGTAAERTAGDEPVAGASTGADTVSSSTTAAATQLLEASTTASTSAAQLDASTSAAQLDASAADANERFFTVLEEAPGDEEEGGGRGSGDEAEGVADEETPLLDQTVEDSSAFFKYVQGLSEMGQTNEEDVDVDSFPEHAGNIAVGPLGDMSAKYKGGFITLLFEGSGTLAVQLRMAEKFFANTDGEMNFDQLQKELEVKKKQLEAEARKKAREEAKKQAAAAKERAKAEQEGLRKRRAEAGGEGESAGVELDIDMDELQEAADDLKNELDIESKGDLALRQSAEGEAVVVATADDIVVVEEDEGPHEQGCCGLLFQFIFDVLGVVILYLVLFLGVSLIQAIICWFAYGIYAQVLLHKDERYQEDDARNFYFAAIAGVWVYLGNVAFLLQGLWYLSVFFISAYSYSLYYDTMDTEAREKIMAERPIDRFFPDLHPNEALGRIPVGQSNLVWWLHLHALVLMLLFCLFTLPIWVGVAVSVKGTYKTKVLTEEELENGGAPGVGEVIQSMAEEEMAAKVAGQSLTADEIKTIMENKERFQKVQNMQEAKKTLKTMAEDENTTAALGGRGMGDASAKFSVGMEKAEKIEGKVTGLGEKVGKNVEKNKGAVA
eukprot:g15970.t1